MVQKKAVTLILIAMASVYATTQAPAESQSIPARNKSSLAATPASPQIERFRDNLDKAQKKGNQPAEADALYDLAKAYFDSRDLSQAEQYMKQCVQVEQGLNRPSSAVRA